MDITTNGLLNMQTTLTTTYGNFDTQVIGNIFGSPITQNNGRVFLLDQVATNGYSTINSANNNVFVADGTNFIQSSWTSGYNLYCQSVNLFLETNFTGDIVLQGANTIVTLYGTGQITGNFYLNGGTLRLGSNVVVKGGSTFYGAGTIDLNNLSLFVEQTTFVDNISFITGGRINLTGTNFCIGTLSISSPSSVITAINGGEIDFAQNGKAGLQFTGSGTYRINNCNLLGIGASNSVGLSYNVLNNVSGFPMTYSNNLGASLTSTTTLALSGVCLELSQTFTQTSNFQFLSRGSTIAANNFVYYVAADITISSTTLSYSRATQTSPSPLVITTGGSITLTGSGRQAPVQGLDGAAGIPGAAGKDGTLFAANKTMAQAYVAGGDPRQLNSTSTLTFGAVPTVVYDAGNAWFTGTPTTGSYIVLAAGETLVWTNVTLEGVFESNYSFGTGAAVVFGNNTKLIMDKDIMLLSTSRVWTFTGIGSVDGAGHDLNLQSAGRIVIDSGATLTLKNMNLYCLVNNAITMQSNTSTLVVKDSTIQLSPVGFVFSNGNLMFTGDCTITTSGNFTGQDNSITFSYSTQGNLTLDKDSSLTLAPEVVFNYRPNLNFKQAFSSAKGWITSGPGAQLILDGATIEATYSGLTLCNGAIFAQRSSTITMDSNTGNNLVILNSFDVQLASDAKLTVNGTVKIL